MNERITELVIETLGKEGVIDSRAFGHWALSDDQLEKFAVMTVRECMKESMDEIVTDDEIAQEKDPLIREYLNGNNQGIVDAVVRFRNHFGVEE